MSNRKSYAPTLQDLRFEFEEYLLEWVDCGIEPMPFEQFVAEQGLTLRAVGGTETSALV